MKKIVFVLEQFYGGGAERVTNALANEMCKLPGYEVHVLTYRMDPEKEYPTDNRVIRHNMDQREDSKNRLRGIVRRVGFFREKISQISPWCVVSLAMPKTVCLLALAMTGMNIPLVLSERNDPKKFPSGKLARGLRLWAYSRANGLVFQTEEARSYFPDSIKRKGIVICNPLTGSMPERYEGERKKQIVNFCRMNAQKNLNLLIDAFYAIADEYPEYTLIIYGDGPLRNELETKVAQLHMQGRILMPGYSSDIYNDIREAALFVSSSDYEGISNSMLEAIALGIPTICTDCPAGGAQETICQGKNGLLVPVKDKEAMAEAVRTVLSNDKFAEHLSREGSKLRYEISADVIAGKWLRYLEKIAN